jgi:transcriptional regulator with XRE-family HTH domain
MLYKSFGKYLKSRRVEKGLTDVELCNDLDIQLSYYRKVELDKAQLSFSLFQKLHKYLELDDITCVVLLKKLKRK